MQQHATQALCFISHANWSDDASRLTITTFYNTNTAALFSTKQSKRITHKNHTS